MQLPVADSNSYYITHTLLYNMLNIFSLVSICHTVLNLHTKLIVELYIYKSFKFLEAW